MELIRAPNKPSIQSTIASCDALIAADPTDIGAYYDKAKALLELNRKKDAIAAYDKIIANAFITKGILLDELGKQEEAIVAFDKAIEVDPNGSDAYNTKGECLMEMGKYKEAAKAYDEVIRILPDESLGYGNKGFALYHLGELEEAVKCYDKEAEIEYDWLVDAKKGKALCDLGNKTEGMEHIQKAMYKFKKGKLDGNCFTDEDGHESVYNKLEVALLKDIVKLLAQ